MKVVICEQDQGIARSMCAILGHYSYKVVSVQKNNDLFKQVNQQRPAVIIVNQSFTENNGLDTLNKLKTNPDTSGIPIIYIGKEFTQTDMYHIKDNYIEVVQEPVKIKKLRHCIDRWTTLRSLYIKH